MKRYLTLTLLVLTATAASIYSAEEPPTATAPGSKSITSSLVDLGVWPQARQQLSQKANALFGPAKEKFGGALTGISSTIGARLARLKQAASGNATSALDSLIDRYKGGKQYLGKKFPNAAKEFTNLQQEAELLINKADALNTYVAGKLGISQNQAKGGAAVVAAVTLPAAIPLVSLASLYPTVLLAKGFVQDLKNKWSSLSEDEKQAAIAKAQNLIQRADETVAEAEEEAKTTK